jgi:hypothetical protein
MSFDFNALLSLSIGLGAVIGWIRFYKTDPAYLPFLLLLSLGFINEVLSIILGYNGYSNVINFNLFNLLESFFLTWQFKEWGLFDKYRKLYYFLLALFLVLWLCETLFTSLHSFASWFSIVHAFVFVMLSINMIIIVSLYDTTPFYRQPVFLICLGLIIFFTYAMLVEGFWIVGFTHKELFRLKVYQIMSYINFFTNLLFAFAFLWIPMRPRYIMES